MRKIILLLSVLFSVSMLSQNLGTTLEEYNYLTKGYKIQVESGLDMKKGYTLKDVPAIFNISINNPSGSVKRQTDFKLLYRDNETIPCAILMIQRRIDNNVTNYYCIPSHSSEMWINFRTDFFADLNKNVAGLNSEKSSLMQAQYAYQFNTLQMLSYSLTTNIK